MDICTIIAKNYLAHARVLARSFAEHHPDGTCHVLIIDEVDGYVDAADEPFALVRPGEIGLGDAWDEMRGAYDVMELSTAVKPWLLRWMLDHHDNGSGIAYFDPDIRVVTRMVELETALREHAVVLTPHVTQGMPRDGRKPTEQDILMAGVYNLGFIGLSDRPDARLLVDWWSERLRRDCHVAPERGFFVDQRWVDFVPGLVEDLLIFRHPGYNVAYWNLPERALGRDADGSFTSNGEPLRFFHYSGYSPERPTLLSKHQDRVRIADSDELAALCDAYGKALVADGFHEVRTLPYEYDQLPSGIRIVPVMRRLYRLALELEQAPASLFTRSGEEDFRRWLAEPAPDLPVLDRLLAQIWQTREDVRAVYPHVQGDDLEGYLGWMVVHGAEQIGLDDALLPEELVARFGSLRESMTPTRPQEAPQAADESLPEPVELDELRTPRAFGVNVAGYLRAELGIGEVARQMIGALDAAGVPVAAVGLHAPLSRQGHDYVASRELDAPYPVNLVCVNADGLPAFAKEAGSAFFRDRYTIGVWWWETSEFPERFHDAFQFVDEVWVGTEFIARALTAVSPVPVVHVPVPVELNDHAPLQPGEQDWPDGFSFYFSWDYNSIAKRKNPLGLVEAYTRAFGPEDGVHLVLKCINAEHAPDAHRRVREAVADRPDIVLVDRYVDVETKNRLMASCDCYVSLHRSEGFGLTMAEAMLLGKPVIATGYSGNLDFMSPANSYLVDHELVPIGPGAEPYDPDGTWAEPDLEHAAALMREVVADPETARERGARAAADLRAAHSRHAVGVALEARLERVAARLPEAPPIELRPTGDEGRVAYLAEIVARGSTPTRRSRLGKGGSAVRRAILRAMKPYTAYQETINRGIAEQLQQSLEREKLADARERARIAELEQRLAVTEARLAAEQRRQRQEIVRGDGATGVLHARTTALEAFAARSTYETRALPYTASDLLGTREVDGVGRVLGYQDADASAAGDDAYRAFEELFRGSEPFIAARQRRYLDLVAGHAPAVDVGCGRGEFLDLLAEAGVPVVGVDADAGMIARCRAKGHENVVHGDAVAYVRELEAGSQGLIFSAQVVEHLPPDALLALISGAAAALRPGGLFIAETVNPHAPPALKTFWMDITHQHPLFPEALLAFCHSAGFRDAYVFHPNGEGDVETDRYTTGEYAIVATR